MLFYRYSLQDSTSAEGMMMNKNNDHIQSLRIDNELFEQIEIESAKQCRSISSFIRFAIVKYLEMLKKERGE